MVTRLSSSRRHGVTSMLAMLYLTLFATLAVGFYASTNNAAQVSMNEQRRHRSLGAAESGMDFIRYQLFQTVIPPQTTGTTLLTELHKDLSAQLNGTANMKTWTVGIDLAATEVNIPAEKTQFITLAADGSKFRCTITRPVGALPADKTIVVKVIGCFANTALGNADRAAVQLIYGPDQRPTNFFDTGMASKGAVTIDTKSAITGVPADQASIMSLATTNPPVTVASGSIAGDITVMNGLNPAIAAGTSVGGSSIPADILANHVDHIDPAAVPEMPMVDTSMYAKYATVAYVPGKASYDNVFIPANMNPIIGGPITFRGVLLIKSPNNVKFNGNVNIQGIIVTDNAPVGTLLTNVITFAGSGNSTLGLDTLPNLPQFAELRTMGGSFLIAPNYDVKFTGNFDAIAGNIVGDRINVQGSADLSITGTVVALKQTLTMGTNGTISFKKSANPLLHTGLKFSDRYVPTMTTYDEVKP